LTLWESIGTHGAASCRAEPDTYRDITMFVKSRLLTPGPTAVAESTRLAMAAAQPHHRSAAFGATFKRAGELLRWFWDTDDDVLFVSGSGTAGMEAAMRTCLRADDDVVVITGGKFAERWQTIAKLIGVQVHAVDIAWGDSVTREQLDAVLSRCTKVDALVMVASETSTGAYHDPALVSSVLRARFPDALLMVDGITAVGTMDISMRRDDIDVLVSGTQKAFGLPPGGAMVGVSQRAWTRAERPGCTAYYLDLRRERKQTATGQSAYTPATPLIIGLVSVLETWHGVGRARVFEHAKALAEATRAAMQALGLELYPTGTPSAALTTVKVPEGLTASQLRTWMRTKAGVTVAGGQDDLKETVLRFGTLGATDPFDVIQGVSAFEMALISFGVDIQPGAGVAAAQEVLRSALNAGEPLIYSP